MTVSTDTFVERMRRHWEDTLGNVSSPSLEAVWKQMCRAFNAAIESQGTETERTWRVLKPPTGTGKSQGLAVYCSLLSKSASNNEEVTKIEDLPKSTISSLEGFSDIRLPVGVLIMTRLKEQANDMAADINRLSDCPEDAPLARAKHSDARLSAEEIEDTQILVVTHEAYRRSLVGSADPDTVSLWPRLSEWKHGERLLHVIDEALDVVDHCQITLEEVRYVQGIIPENVARAHPAEMKLLGMVCEVLREVSRFTARMSTSEKPPSGDEEERDERKDHVVWRDRMELPENVSLTPLRSALKGVQWDTRIEKRHDAGRRAYHADRVDKLLKNVDATVRQWAWYSRQGKLDTFNAARLIVPESLRGPVVLDATASHNLMWKLFQEAQTTIPTPQNARSYANVTLHVARAAGIGKTGMKKALASRVPRLLADLRSRLKPENKVLIVCHKLTEGHLAGYDYGAGEVSLAHWNALDGRNDWKNHDTVVIFGLPYRDSVWAPNTFFALQGVRDDAWLQQSSQRVWNDCEDIHKELERGQLAVSVIQAINRIRCRKVVDAEGNCPRADVYLILPRDVTGDYLLQALRTEMPHINVQDWEFELDSDKPAKGGRPRRTDHVEAVIAYMKTVTPGVYTATMLRKALGIARNTWQDLKARLLDPETPEGKQLAEIGVSFKVERSRKGYEKLSLLKS